MKKNKAITYLTAAIIGAATIRSSTHGSKDPECACFGELGLNGEAKASRFEPNLSLSILKYKAERQKEFTDYMFNLLEADKDDVFEFLISLPDDEFSFIVSVYDRLFRSLSLENEIREAVESTHAPGNKTRNEILSLIMKHLRKIERQKMVSFLNNHANELENLFRYGFFKIDSKDFYDWLDYYDTIGKTVDKKLIKKVAKMLDIKFSDSEIERTEDSYVS